MVLAMIERSKRLVVLMNLFPFQICPRATALRRVSGLGGRKRSRDAHNRLLAGACAMQLPGVLEFAAQIPGPRINGCKYIRARGGWAS